MKALVVDDSAVMRKVVTGALSRAGITEVSHAGNGLEAISAADAEEFQLVLMDWNMPQMTGIEAVRHLRANGKKMPIVMVTTEAEKTRVLEALKAGANNYIIKPFEPHVFVEKIRKVLDGVSE